MYIKIKIILLTAFLSLGINSIKAQAVQLLNSGTKISIRGLSVVNNDIVWISGSEGTVGKSTDGGVTWQLIKVKGFEQTDFRDIEAFDDKTAMIIGIAEPAYILRTTDGGDTWQTVYENKAKGMFLDAMEFSDDKKGTVIGDPIDNRFFMTQTFDGGKTWQDVPSKNCPVADSGEACFASSGTNIRAVNKKEYVFISGGIKSSLFMPNIKIALPILQGKNSTGANSIAVKNSSTMIVVGGDFTTRDSTTQNCCITTDGGKTFSIPVTAPHGYRSCVEWLEKSNWISCGLNGVDISNDEGKNWNWISKTSFNVCRKAKKGTAVFFAGGGGRVGKLVY